MSQQDKKVPLTKFFPDIVKYWDYEQNRDLKPEMLTKGSPKKIYIFCPVCNNSRISTVNNAWHLNVDGIPEIVPCLSCANKQAGNRKSVWAADVCSEFMDWWDVKKNKGVDPARVSVAAKTSYYFICPECGETILRKPQVFLRKQNDGTYKPVPCQKCHPTIQKNRKPLIEAVPDIEKYWDYEKNNGAGPGPFLQAPVRKYGQNVLFVAHLYCGMSVSLGIKAMMVLVTLFIAGHVGNALMKTLL